MGILLGDLILLVEAFGTILGVVWFIHWVRKEQVFVGFHWQMNKRRIWYFFKELGGTYATKLFGESVGGFVLLGRSQLALRGITGRVAARYGTVGVVSETVASTQHLTLFVFLLIVGVTVAELVYIVHKNPRILHDGRSFGKLLLETFITFCAVGLIVDLVTS